MNFDEIYDKYNLVFINGQRFYKIDLSTKSIILDNTTPIYFKINDTEITCNSWKKLIVGLFVYLNNTTFKTDSELISLENTWGTQKVFSDCKATNFELVRNKLYINCNLTSIHSFRTIQLLLDYYDINTSNCELIIRRHPISEPIEVADFIRNKVINSFKFYLKNNLNKSDEAIYNIVHNIETINNKFLCKISTGYNDFFLIDDRQMFLNCLTKTLNFMDKYSSIKVNVKCKVRRHLEFLSNFYKEYESVKNELINEYVQNKNSDDSMHVDTVLDSMSIDELCELL